MSAFAACSVSNPLRFLVLHDVDLPSSYRLAEHFIPKEPQFDACIVCGPLIHRPLDDTQENQAVAIGEASTLLAQLENIVCRVMYVAGPDDPVDIIFRELHLTPNSINIHARWLPLTQGLQICGYTERSQLELGKHDEEDLELLEEDVNRQASNSASIIRDLLESGPKCDDSFANSSILVVMNKFAHTLNEVLFFQQDELKAAGVSLCIYADTENAGVKVGPVSRSIKGVTAISPKSLRLLNSYTVVEYRSTSIDESTGMFKDEKKWKLSSAEVFYL